METLLLLAPKRVVFNHGRVVLPGPSSNASSHRVAFCQSPWKLVFAPLQSSKVPVVGHDPRIPSRSSTLRICAEQHFNPEAQHQHPAAEESQQLTEVGHKAVNLLGGVTPLLERRGSWNGSTSTATQDDESLAKEKQTSKAYDTARRTLYLVDVHPLCYDGKKPRPTALLKWMKLLFDQVSLSDPVIAVMDGERGNEYRKGLFPSYKEKRNKYKPLSGIRGPYFKGDEMDLREAFPHIFTFFAECSVKVLKVEDAEADDVIATLTQQALAKGIKVVVASPDMDYRQLLCDNVNIVLPLPEFGRWSFYTLEQYRAQHNCDPNLDLGLRCMLGDQSDSVPGLPDLAPGFGRKTALKLMKKHGSLENLLVAAKNRTVGKPYIQEALELHRDVLCRNLQILSFRRDVNVILDDEWCRPRDRSNDAQAFKRLQEILQNKRYSSSY